MAQVLMIESDMRVGCELSGRLDELGFDGPVSFSKLPEAIDAARAKPQHV